MVEGEQGGVRGRGEGESVSGWMMRSRLGFGCCNWAMGTPELSGSLKSSEMRRSWFRSGSCRWAIATSGLFTA